MKKRVQVTSQFLARPLSRTGEADILSPQDRFEMLDLIQTVSWCIDAGDYDILATVVTDDFVFDHALGVVRGRKAVLEFLRSNPSYFDGLRQHNLNPLLRSVDLSNSIVASYLVVTRVGSENTPGPLPHTICHGICTDDLRKEKDLWKLARRTVDQMVVSESLVADSSKRSFYALTAAERRAAIPQQ